VRCFASSKASENDGGLKKKKPGKEPIPGEWIRHKDKTVTRSQSKKEFGGEYEQNDNPSNAGRGGGEGGLQESRKKKEKKSHHKRKKKGGSGSCSLTRIFIKREFGKKPNKNDREEVRAWFGGGGETVKKEF